MMEIAFRVTLLCFAYYYTRLPPCQPVLYWEPANLFTRRQDLESWEVSSVFFDTLTSEDSHLFIRLKQNFKHSIFILLFCKACNDFELLHRLMKDVILSVQTSSNNFLNPKLSLTTQFTAFSTPATCHCFRRTKSIILICTSRSVLSSSSEGNVASISSRFVSQRSLAHTTAGSPIYPLYCFDQSQTNLLESSRLPGDWSILSLYPTWRMSVLISFCCKLKCVIRALSHRQIQGDTAGCHFEFIC